MYLCYAAMLMEKVAIHETRQPANKTQRTQKAKETTKSWHSTKKRKLYTWYFLNTWTCADINNKRQKKSWYSLRHGSQVRRQFDVDLKYTDNFIFYSECIANDKIQRILFVKVQCNVCVCVCFIQMLILPQRP